MIFKTFLFLKLSPFVNLHNLDIYNIFWLQYYQICLFKKKEGSYIAQINN